MKQLILKQGRGPGESWGSTHTCTAIDSLKLTRDTATSAWDPWLGGPASQTRGTQRVGDRLPARRRLKPQCVIGGRWNHTDALCLVCTISLIGAVLNMNGFNMKMFSDFFKQPKPWQPGPAAGTKTRN